MSIFFIDPECAVNDILVAKDKKEWVECQKQKALFGAIVVSIVVVIIIVIMWFMEVSTWMMLATAAGLGIIWIGVGFAGYQAGYNYDMLTKERDGLVGRDPTYADWNKFVQYKRDKMVAESQAKAADAMNKQANAQGVMAATGAVNTTANIYQMFKK